MAYAYLVGSVACKGADSRLHSAASSVDDRLESGGSVLVVVRHGDCDVVVERLKDLKARW